LAGATTIDFFKSQEIAKRKTSILIGYYCLAVVMIIAAVYVTAMVVFQGAMLKAGQDVPVKSLWNPDLFMYIAGGTSLIVVLGTVFKINQLSSGGAAVAELLGGVPLDSTTHNLDERKILNVVEEMSIASGIPVPRVYILEEESINAFAAGFSPSDAVIGVTRGCVEQLTRDELQGVVAHEFSHILNGDMKLNIRLLGVLNGILVIGLIGYWIFRSTARSRSKKGNNLPIVLFGLVIWVVGYIGVFFGKLIKSAVSRQREYLADASAVQFTRNPGGISGALKKIGGYAGGTRISNDHAEEASHFFFCNGLSASFLNLMATHPPIEDRIKRLDPMFNAEDERSPGLKEVVPPLPDESAGALAGVSRFSAKPADVVASVGAPTPAHVRHAAVLIAGLPEVMVAAVREPAGAQAAVYSLLINGDEKVREKQTGYLAGHADPPVQNLLTQLIPVADGLKDEGKLPLVDMAIPVLKGLSLNQYNVFRENIQALVAADKQVDLFEYTLQRILMRHLDTAFRLLKTPGTKYLNTVSVLPVCEKLLSCLAYWGADDAESAQAAFDKGAEKLEAGTILTMCPVDDCGLPMLDVALNEAAAASPVIKKKVLDACVTCVAADGYVTIEEAELIRAVAASIDCPLPPFLPGKLT